MGGTFDGRTAVVTGASRGIGRATALALAVAGARVGLVARSVADLAEVAREIEDSGRSAFVVGADLADVEERTSAVARIRAEFGRVDILVNNAAAPGPAGPSVEVDTVEWARVLEINVVAVATLAFALLPPMLAAGWGRIVNVSSGVAADPTSMTGANAYVTSKVALEGYTLNLAAELAGSGVTVNVVRPGSVDTAMMTYLREQESGTFPAELEKWAVGAYEAGELFRPDQVARWLVTCLAGEDTGQIWDIEETTGGDPADTQDS